jgi:hypothetical protein
VLLNAPSMSYVSRDGRDPGGIFSALLIGVSVYIKASVAELSCIPPICVLYMTPYLNAAALSLRVVKDVKE